MSQYADAVDLYTRCLFKTEAIVGLHLKRSLCRCMLGQSSVLYVEDLKRYLLFTRAVEVSPGSRAELIKQLDVILGLFPLEEELGNVESFFRAKIEEYY